MIVQHPRIHIWNDPTRQQWRIGDFRGGKGGGKFGRGKGGGKGKYRASVLHKQRNAFGFAGLMAEEIEEEDDGEFVAWLGAEDEDDPYSDPAHWYDEEDAAENVYTYWEEDTEWQDFLACLPEEWSKKYDADATAETALETAELECVV